MRVRSFMKIIILLAGLLFIYGCAEQPDGPPENPQSTYALSDFTSSEECRTCHPQYYEEWSGSMHRYATNDPIWMLASNGLQQSTHGKLKDFCFQCHSPIAFLTGSAPSTFEISRLDPIVREGVNCDVCHKMRAPHTTTDQTIRYNIEKGKTQYGQLADPVPNGFHPSAYDATFDRSEKCRECHDLIINGVPTEMTYTEWQDSPWGAMSVECQTCHMRAYTGQAAIGGPTRNNLHRHDFVGVDVAITDFPYKAEQREAAAVLLQNSATMSLQLPLSAAPSESTSLSVTVTNDKTGHNLPTSVFFFRQMWVEVLVFTSSDTVFASGSLDSLGDLRTDPHLALFAGTLYNNGVEANVFELDSLVNNSIPPFASRSSSYGFTFPRGGLWKVRVRLLYRPFSPALFRAVGAESYIDQIPTYVMEEETREIAVR